MLDATSLAAILDPERTIDDWWSAYYKSASEDPNYHIVWTFIGPANLHTAREHCWRMEEWLEARNIGWIRHVANDLSAVTCVMLATSSVHPDNVCNPNHAAALNAAIERINNG